MKNEPKVSIIVPVYKVEKHVSRCSRSLFEQTFHNIEYIFVDDASPDNSIQIIKDVLEEYPERKAQCVFLQHSVNKGLTSARNTGLKRASGKYILHCDSDDWQDVRMVEKMYTAIEANNADVAVCGFKMVYADRSEVKKTCKWTGDKVLDLKNYIGSVWTCVWNVMVMRDLFETYQIFSLESLTFCEDFNLMAKLLLHARKVCYVAEPLYNYNQMNSNSIMKTLNEKSMLSEQTAYLDVIEYYKNQGFYELYAQELCWRVLKSKQEWVLDESTYHLFLNMHPESHRYIWSCPYINVKLKIMMWSLSHHCTIVARFMLLLRKIRHRNDI